MEKITILGSGQTSMLAAVMLSSNFDVEILEEKEDSIQSHFALLRFGSNNIEKITGIQLEEVEIKKAIYYRGQIYNQSNIKFDNLYSQKTTGKIQKRSIGNLSEGKRYIPPSDFFDQLKAKTSHLITYNADYSKVILDKSKCCISTLPMKKNLDLCKRIQNINFSFEQIFVFELTLKNCNIHQTIYYPDIIGGVERNFNPAEMHCPAPAYRISIIGHQIKFEISQLVYNYYKSINKNGELEFNFSLLIEDILDQFTASFGIIIDDKKIYESIIQDILLKGLDKIIKEQKFGKISPIKEDLRQEIIFSLTEKFNTYSLGRFSCWRGILLDDIVKDVKRIEHIINMKRKTKEVTQLIGYKSQLVGD